MAQQQQLVRVAWFMPRKKADKMGWLDIVAGLETDGFHVTELDPMRPIQEQGTFDLVLYKLTDFLVKHSDAEAQRIIANFEEFERHVRDSGLATVLVDSLTAQRQVIDREPMYSLFAEIDRVVEQVQCPRYVTLTEKAAEYSQHLSSIQFPAMCKQVVACGSHDSHHMGIVFNEQDVREHFEPPVIVQEFFNHNATIFKIFVVGSQVSVVRRPSIRDVGDSGEAIIFNSQHMQAIIDKAHFERDIDPPHEVLQAIAREITARQGLTMFGFDVIRNSRTGQYGVIDLNFWPGYVGVADLTQQLQRFIRERVSAVRPT